MASIVLRDRSVLIRYFMVRQGGLAAAFLVSVTLTANVALAQNCSCDEREAARTWTLHNIAVMQAAAGDVTGAKTTVVADWRQPVSAERPFRGDGRVLL